MQESSLVLNRWQQASFLSGANEIIDVVGRGGGKSFVLGPSGQRMAKMMPRGLFYIASDTYDRLLNTTLPAIMDAWEQMGLIEGEDYLINKKPADELGWEKPYSKRLKHDNTIFLKNGAAFKLVSQAAKNARGYSFDGGLIDEMLTIKRGFFENDLVPTYRGNTTRLNNPLHFCLHGVTSMPWDASGDYILQRGNYYAEDGHRYDELHATLPRLLAHFLDIVTDAERRRFWLHEVIPVISKLKYYVSRNNTYYSQGTVFDNLSQYNWEKLKHNWRTIERTSFLIEFLNQPYQAVGDKFYYVYNDDKHCYEPDDSKAEAELAGIITRESFRQSRLRDSSKDMDVDPALPLDISGDWQVSISPFVVGQLHKECDEYRIVNDFYVLAPDWIPEVIRKFCEYYRPHVCKVVRFYYDSSAIGKHNTNVSVTEKVEQEFAKYGWRVDMCYIGKQPTHQDRYKLVNGIMEHTDSRVPKLVFNRVNTRTLRMAMVNTVVKRSATNGFTKNKTHEKSESYPQERAPHFTDAFDTLVWGVFIEKIEFSGGFVNPVASK
jgi:hypothetical protein